MRHLDDPHVHRGTHDTLGNRFLHLHTFLVRLVHYHNGSWSLAPRDRRDNHVPEHLEFYANSVHLYVCDAVVQCIERDKRVPDDKRVPVDKRTPDDTMIQMSKKNSHEPKQRNKYKKSNENSKRLITLTT